MDIISGVAGRFQSAWMRENLTPTIETKYGGHLPTKKIDYNECMLARPIGELLSYANILTIAFKISEFRTWLREHHSIQNHGDLLDGYKFFLYTCVRCLITALQLDTSMGLSEDETFRRASYVGVRLTDVPNSCDKTIAIKRIWSAAKPIRESRSWSQLENSMRDLNAVTDIFS